MGGVLTIRTVGEEYLDNPDSYRDSTSTMACCVYIQPAMSGKKDIQAFNLTSLVCIWFFHLLIIHYTILNIA